MRYVQYVTPQKFLTFVFLRKEPCMLAQAMSVTRILDVHIRT